MTNTDENTLYARYLAARFATERLPAPPWPADPADLAAAQAAHVLGCAYRGRSLEDLPAAPEIAARVAALLSAAPPIPAAKPVSGAALAAEAAAPGYAAPTNPGPLPAPTPGAIRAALLRFRAAMRFRGGPFTPDAAAEVDHLLDLADLVWAGGQS